MLKKAIDLENLSEKDKQSKQQSSKESVAGFSGIAGDVLKEPVPEFNKTECEKIFFGENNTWLVFGRDRYSDKLSGYGGKGFTRAGMIDLVVGRNSANQKLYKDGERVFVDPNFSLDASRVYLSQLADIDDYFNLAITPSGIPRSVSRAAIGIKSDAVRIIGREGVKIVTGVDQNNSLGSPLSQVRGVELIAGNDTRDVQPMVKGDNAVEALEKLAGHVEKLAGIVDSFMTIQSQYNDVVSSHFHISPFFGIPNAPSQTAMQKGIQTSLELLSEVKVSLTTIRTNLVNYKNNYLQPFGKGYVNSRWNKTN